MSQLAAGIKTITDNGRERKTDGLWKHLGLIDGGTLRGVNYLPPRAGQGVEIGNIPGAGPTQGVLMSYDRDLDTFRDLTIQARNLLLSASGTLNLAGSSLVLPPGSITTSMLAAGAAQQRIASYQAAPTWSTSATVSWQETIIQVNGTSTGVDTRFEATIVWSHSAAGMGVYFAFFIDGAPYGGALSTVTVPAANYAITTSMLLYASPGAGLHRFAVGISNSGGTFTIFTGGASVLYVTEQKR